MRTTTRRRLDVALLFVGAVVVGVIAVFGAVVSNSERIDRMWVGATLDANGGPTAIHEVIDDNFGNSTNRHGLDRKIPGLGTDSVIHVSSPDAPAAIHRLDPVYVGGVQGIDMEIGDPNQTVSGHRRYLIDYALSTIDDGHKMAWDAVGTGWILNISKVEIHVVAPYDLTDVKCQTGTAGSTDPCTIKEVAPGHLVARVDSVAPGHGVTIRAVRGAALAAAPALPNAPTTLPPDPGAGIAKPAAAALVAALLASFVASRLVRRAGRERVGAGGVADAAWAEGATSTSEVRMDAKDLADMATTEFSPPEGITPAQGGIILAEGLKPEHKVAWLIQASIDGAVDLVEEGGKTVQIKRTAPGDPETQEILDKAFGGRDEITLGGYDKTFASGWTEVGTKLEAWADGSGLWDPAGDKHRTVVRVLGVLGGLLGLAGVGVGAGLAARFAPGWIALATVAGLLAGAGWAMVVRSWELRVRTPKGSGQWLRIESFRRFLHESEASHAEDAARRGLLREYTAWAVAVGEVDRWRHAVTSSTTIPPTSAGLGYVMMAPLLVSSTSHAASVPSSSSGGFGGGGVGGGGGGGGGGNW